MPTVRWRSSGFLTGFVVLAEYGKLPELLRPMLLPAQAIFRIFFGTALFALAAAAAHAQTCKVTCPDGTSMKVSCDTKVDPCPLKDLDTPPAIGSQEWRSVFDRFHDVLQRLQKIEPTLMDGQPIPATYPDIVRQSGQLYEESALLLDTIALRNRWLVDQLSAQDGDLKALTIRDVELRKRIEALPAEKSAAQMELARANPVTNGRAIPALAIENAANALRERANQAAQDCIYWLTIAEPPGVKPIGEGLLVNRQTARQESLIWTPVAPEKVIAATPSGPVAARVPFTGTPVRREQPPGSALDRLAAAESLIPQLTDAITVMRRNEATQARNEAVLESARVGLAGQLNLLMRGQAEVNAIRSQMLGLRSANAKDLQANQARALGNLRRAATEAYILEVYRDRVVIPEVKAFLSANRINRTLDHASVVRIYTARSTVLAARTSKPLVALPRLLAVQQRAARVVSDYRTFAGEAALRMDRDGASQVQSIQDEVRRGVAPGTVDFLSGSERDSGVLAAIAHVLFAQRPKSTPTRRSTR